MSALFNLKMLGSAALALGISTVSLWPEMASANIVFDFSGICDFEGCPTRADTATGVLTLTDGYMYGEDITSATFVSFSYSSGEITFDIASGDSPRLGGGLNSDGSSAATGGPSIFVSAGLLFTASGRQFSAQLQEGSTTFVESGFTFGFTNVTPPPAVPEPSTWAMMLIGFAGLGYAGHRASRKSAAVAA
jgi:hypothetical protein